MKTEYRDFLIRDWHDRSARRVFGNSLARYWGLLPG